MNCPICGRPMIHYRMTGYRCHVENHNELAREMDAAIIDAVGKSVSWQDFDEYMYGKLPESIRDIRRRYVKDKTE